MVGWQMADSAAIIKVWPKSLKKKDVLLERAEYFHSFTRLIAIFYEPLSL